MSVTTYRLPDYVGMGRWGYVSAGTEVIDLAGTPESYRVKGMCMNCKWEGQIRFPLGMLVTRHGKGIDCPACACPFVQGGSLVARDSASNDSSTSLSRAQEASAKQHDRDMARSAEGRR